MANRTEIPIGKGLRIVAEQNSDLDYDRELYVGVVDANGAWIQDLVCVQNEYRYKDDGQLDYAEGLIRVLVWSDATREDLTDEFVIPLRADHER